MTLHIHIHARDVEFQGSEKQWVEAIKVKHGYVTFRPRPGIIQAKNKAFETVGEYNTSKQQGTIN